jgi:hypothetical protein
LATYYPTNYDLNNYWLVHFAAAEVIRLQYDSCDYYLSKQLWVFDDSSPAFDFSVQELSCFPTEKLLFQARGISSGTSYYFEAVQAH